MFEYNSPIISMRRKGTPDDPFIPYEETLQISNGKVSLTEIPNRTDGFEVTGEDIFWIETDGELKQNNWYQVDYNIGEVRFIGLHNGKSLTFKYLGEGSQFIPVDRVYTKHNNGDVTETLGDIIEQGTTAIDSLKEINQAIANADSATTSANNAATLANEKANLAQDKINEIDESETIRITNENQRVINENERLTKETERESNEVERKTNETNRISSESQRELNENERLSNELLRIQQEQNRQTNTQTAISSAEIATNNANTKAQLADDKANLAQAKVDSLNSLETTVNQTIADSQTATANANLATTNANSSATEANTQAQYAKTQGDYAKTQGDSLQDIIDGTGLIPSTEKGQPNGVATLDGNGKVPLNQLPDISQEKTYIVLDETERLALTGLKSGDRCYEKNTGDSYIHDGLVWHIQAKADWENVNLDWNNISNRPSSSPAQIDNSVSKVHSHSNKTVLDKLTQSDLDKITSNETKISNVETKTTENTNNINTLNTKVDNHLNDYMPHDSGLSSYASDVDPNGVYTVVDFRRTDSSLHLKSTLSNPDGNGNYQTVTWQFYKSNGTTIALTVKWTITYDAEGNIVNKEVE
ncbi:hypothetical protein [Cytobacillus praedii]|uniref:DUF2479 domain-containing protein n=1 Tax=Cytobacillus praedii TaxID=1742358 RepID=A0A4R1AP98_9BACI|nr:hypothetical protein [Cytobacillus praedii]TCJ01599.1 hypothetical protein E0Y62_23190 [Cytobacillus praedii]